MPRRRGSNRKLDERLGLSQQHIKRELDPRRPAVSRHATDYHCPDPYCKEELGSSKRRRKSGSNLGELRNEILAASELQHKRSFSGLVGRSQKLRQRSRSGSGEEVSGGNARKISSVRNLGGLTPIYSMLEVLDSESRCKKGTGVRDARNGRRSFWVKRKKSVNKISGRRRRSFGTLVDILPPRMANKRTGRDSKGTPQAGIEFSQASSQTRAAVRKTTGGGHLPWRRGRRESWASEEAAGSESYPSHWKDNASFMHQGDAKAAPVRAQAQRRRSSFRDILHVLSGGIAGSVSNGTAQSWLENKEYLKRRSPGKEIPVRGRSFRDLADVVTKSTGVVGLVPSSRLCDKGGDDRSQSSYESFLHDSFGTGSVDCPHYDSRLLVRNQHNQSPAQSQETEDCGPRTIPLEINVDLKTRSKRRSSKSKPAARHLQTEQASRKSSDDEIVSKKGSARRLQSSQELDFGVSRLVGAGLQNMRASFRVPSIEFALDNESPDSSTATRDDEWGIDPNLTIVSPTCTALLEKQESLRSIRSSIVEGEYQQCISPRSDRRASTFSKSESTPKKLERPMLDMGFEIDRGGITRRSSKQIVLSPMIHDLLEQAQVDGDSNKRSSMMPSKPSIDGGKRSKRYLFAGGEADCTIFASMLRSRRLSGRGFSLTKNEGGGSRTPSKHQE